MQIIGQLLQDKNTQIVELARAGLLVDDFNKVMEYPVRLEAGLREMWNKAVRTPVRVK